MFSAVIPIYNHASFVAQAICSALRSPLVVEVLLLDDGSTDGSRRVAARMAAAYPGRVQDLTPPRGGNRGAHHRLNELVAQARSEWIAVLNSDDAFVSDRFETVVGDARFAHADFIFGNLLFMNQHGALIGQSEDPSTQARLSPRVSMCTAWSCRTSFWISCPTKTSWAPPAT